MRFNIKHIPNIIIPRMLCAIVMLFIALSCTEEIPLNTESGFEDVLVIEAVITNELKRQEIFLTRSYLLEGEPPVPENSATVRLLSSDGNSYAFEDTNSGVYKSIDEFQAMPNQTYRLEITTNDGKDYVSENVALTQETQIDDLFVERNFNDDGDEGVSILINSFDSTGNSRYYRYEYEETYKIIAPLYSPLELEVLNDDFPYTQEFLNSFANVEELMEYFFDLRVREEQAQVCYNTVNSNTIILENTNAIPEDRVERFEIRFLMRDNFIISHRYSVLVRQYVQSQDAYEYYKTLRDFATSESILTENQIGFLEGNITQVQNPEEKVVGFFQVSSVDSRRIYFNYEDLFQGEPLPPYFISCDDFLEPVFLVEDFVHNIIGSPIIEALTSNNPFIFYDLNTEGNHPSPFAHTPYTLVLEPCGDCRVIGENTAPDFWEE